MLPLALLLLLPLAPLPLPLPLPLALLPLPRVLLPPLARAVGSEPCGRRGRARRGMAATVNSLIPKCPVPPRGMMKVLVPQRTTPTSVIGLARGTPERG
ncbi:hypothetical protein ACW9HC_01875 [Nocardia gipuzkoensis]